MNRLPRKEDQYAAKRVADSLLEQDRVKGRRLRAGRPMEMGEDEEQFLLQLMATHSLVHEK